MSHFKPHQILFCVVLPEENMFKLTHTQKKVLQIVVPAFPTFVIVIQFEHYSKRMMSTKQPYVVHINPW